MIQRMTWRDNGWISAVPWWPKHQRSQKLVTLRGEAKKPPHKVVLQPPKREPSEKIGIPLFLIDHFPRVWDKLLINRLLTLYSDCAVIIMDWEWPLHPRIMEMSFVVFSVIEINL